MLAPVLRQLDAQAHLRVDLVPPVEQPARVERPLQHRRQAGRARLPRLRAQILELVAEEALGRAAVERRAAVRVAGVLARQRQPAAREEQQADLAVLGGRREVERRLAVVRARLDVDMRRELVLHEQPHDRRRAGARRRHQQVGAVRGARRQQRVAEGHGGGTRRHVRRRRLA